MSGRHCVLDHKQPVDLAGQRPDAAAERLAAGPEREQQRAFGAAEHRLDGVHDLVDEQQAVPLDVGFGDPAFQGHQADNLLATAREPLRRGVRDEAHLIDHRQHPLPVLVVDGVDAVVTEHDQAGRTRSEPRITRDTVAVDTPASRATSYTVGIRGPRVTAL